MPREAVTETVLRIREAVMEEEARVTRETVTEDQTEEARATREAATGDQTEEEARAIRETVTEGRTEEEVRAIREAVTEGHREAAMVGEARLREAVTARGRV